jgi:GNAT superfamily N-acetyltransferase
MEVTSVERPEDLLDALMVFHRGHRDRVDGVLRQIAAGEFDRRNILVSKQEGAITGTILCQRLPGNVALVWPAVTTGARPDEEDALYSEAFRHAGRVHFLHTFVPSVDASRSADALERNGFRHITRLWEMRREAGLLVPPDPSIELVPLIDVDDSSFQHILIRCHEDSLDCPEIHHFRTGQELIDGYRDSVPDPGQWFLALHRGDAVGVVLLSGGNIAFLGVLPEHRMKGFGRGILRSAIGKSEGPMNLIVDGRNFRAYRLYRLEGFSYADSYEFFMRSTN